MNSNNHHTGVLRSVAGTITIPASPNIRPHLEENGQPMQWEPAKENCMKEITLQELKAMKSKLQEELTVEQKETNKLKAMKKKLHEEMDDELGGQDGYLNMTTWELQDEVLRLKANKKEIQDKNKRGRRRSQVPF